MFSGEIITQDQHSITELEMKLSKLEMMIF